MASSGVIYDQFRQRLRGERERRGWSQQKVADLLASQGVYVHPTAVSLASSALSHLADQFPLPTAG
jgi:transcriptional regulator with XRE-family HTH domain